MSSIKIDPDLKRFARYQSVVNMLLAKESFHKSDTYKDLKDVKPQFIGRVISKLLKDGYLTNSGPKTKPEYSWLAKRSKRSWPKPSGANWSQPKLNSPAARAAPLNPLRNF